MEIKKIPLFNNKVYSNLKDFIPLNEGNFYDVNIGDRVTCINKVTGQLKSKSKVVGIYKNTLVVKNNVGHEYAVNTLHHDIYYKPGYKKKSKERDLFEYILEGLDTNTITISNKK